MHKLHVSLRQLPLVQNGKHTACFALVLKALANCSAMCFTMYIEHVDGGVWNAPRRRECDFIHDRRCFITPELHS